MIEGVVSPDDVDHLLKGFFDFGKHADDVRHTFGSFDEVKTFMASQPSGTKFVVGYGMQGSEMGHLVTGNRSWLTGTSFRDFQTNWALPRSSLRGYDATRPILVWKLPGT
jgi:hypothetical protein